MKDTAAFGLALPPISAPPPVTYTALRATAAVGGEGHGESGSPKLGLAQQTLEKDAVKEQAAQPMRRTRRQTSPLVAEKKGAVARSGAMVKKGRDTGVQKTIIKTMRVTRSAAAKTSKIEKKDTQKEPHRKKEVGVLKKSSVVSPKASSKVKDQKGSTRGGKVRGGLLGVTTRAKRAGK